MTQANQDTLQVCGRHITGVWKTHFTTHWSSTVSFEPHLRPLQRLVETGSIHVKVCCTSLISYSLLIVFQHNEAVKSFFTDKKVVNTFEIVMYQYIAIVAPLAHSIWSLESATSYASDVYIFWLAIAATLKIFSSTQRRSFHLTMILSSQSSASSTVVGKPLLTALLQIYTSQLSI